MTGAEIRDAILGLLRNAKLTFEESEDMASFLEGIKHQLPQLAAQDIVKRTAMPAHVRMETVERENDEGEFEQRLRFRCGKCGATEWQPSYSEERHIILMRMRWQREHAHP